MPSVTRGLARNHLLYAKSRGLNKVRKRIDYVGSDRFEGLSLRKRRRPRHVGVPTLSLSVPKIRSASCLIGRSALQTTLL